MNKFSKHTILTSKFSGALLIALPAALALSACAEEAASPTADETLGDDAMMQDEIAPAETMPVDPPSDSMSEGEVLDDATGEAATTGEEGSSEKSMSEEDAKEAMQKTE